MTVYRAPELLPLEELLHPVGEALSLAIAIRDPATARHGRRVADLALALARSVHAAADGPFAHVSLTGAQLSALRYAALLHDLAKIGVPDAVLWKEKRLPPRCLDRIEHGLELARCSIVEARLRGQIDERGAWERSLALDRDLALVRRLNEPAVRVSAVEVGQLRAAARRWRRRGGAPVLTARDVERLCAPSGLCGEEWAQMKRHALYSEQILQRIPWPRRLRRVPAIVGAHHERLDGGGYPLGVRGDAVPFESQLLAVCDVFDALCDDSRPYRDGVSPERALAVLRAEARRGRLLAPAVELLADLVRIPPAPRCVQAA